MEDFTNHPISLTDLPKYESVPMHPIKPEYWKIIRLNLIFLAALMAIAIAAIFVIVDEIEPLAWLVPAFAAAFVVLLFVLYRKALRNMGYAFREHDVIFRHGVITHTTTVIPYNRIQHVELHEGWMSRMLGLAKVQVYTAGSGTGDISIPGLGTGEAATIKQLLMGKIQQKL